MDAVVLACWLTLAGRHRRPHHAPSNDSRRTSGRCNGPVRAGQNQNTGDVFGQVIQAETTSYESMTLWRQQEDYRSELLVNKPWHHVLNSGFTFICYSAWCLQTGLSASRPPPLRPPRHHHHHHHHHVHPRVSPPTWICWICPCPPRTCPSCWGCRRSPCTTAPASCSWDRWWAPCCCGLADWLTDWLADWLTV